MELRQLDKEELTALYQNEMTAVFPRSELKPLAAMLRLMDLGRYDPLAAIDGGERVGYAMMWLPQDRTGALLEYLGVLRGRRNGGLGGRILELVRPALRRGGGPGPPGVPRGEQPPAAAYRLLRAQRLSGAGLPVRPVRGAVPLPLPGAGGRRPEGGGHTPGGIRSVFLPVAYAAVYPAPPGAGRGRQARPGVGGGGVSRDG